jgi:ankyrin repeat protein
MSNKREITNMKKQEKVNARLSTVVEVVVREEGQYEASDSLSPRVERQFNSHDYSVDYSAKQGEQDVVEVKRYMLSPNKIDVDEERKASPDSISDLELASLQKALSDNHTLPNKVFLWDIIAREREEIHTLCVVKISDILYLVDPNTSEYSAKFANWINTLSIGINAQNIEHIPGKVKSQFYKSVGAEKRDCIDIAFKIAQRINNNLNDIESKPLIERENKIREIIKHLSNISKVNGDLGAFDENSYLSLQSSDLALSGSALSLLKKYDELDKAQKKAIDKKSYKHMEDFKRDFRKKSEEVEKLTQELEAVENEHSVRLAEYGMEKRKILASQSHITEPIEAIEYDKNGWQHIHRAIYNNNLAEFERLLKENGERISCLTSNGQNVLHMACLYGRTGFIDFIKDHYSELFDSLLQGYDNQGRNPLHIAYYAGKNETADQLLIQYPDLINSLTKNSQTVLHVAAMYGHVNLVQKIIHDHPKFLSIYDKNGRMPLHSAIYGGQKAVVEYLWKNYPDCFTQVTKRGEDLVYLAAIYKHPELVELLQQLLKYDLNVVHQDGYALLHKLYNDSQNKQMIEMFLKMGANPDIKDKRGDTLAHYAAENNDIELLALLQGYKADFNVRNRSDQTPLDKSIDRLSNDAMRFLANNLEPVLSVEMKILVAVCQQDIQKLMELLEQIKSPEVLNNPINNHGLIVDKACTFGNLQIIEILLNHGCASGESLLEEACYADYELTLDQRASLVRYLIDKKIPISAKAIHNTLYLNDITILNILLDAGGDPNVDNGIGFTPLLSILNQPAIGKNQYNIIELLLAKGANVLQCDKYVGNALHLIAERGHLKAVQIILEHAERNGQLKELLVSSDGQAFHGKDAYQIAIIKNETQVAQFLKKYFPGQEGFLLETVTSGVTMSADSADDVKFMGNPSDEKVDDF